MHELSVLVISFNTRELTLKALRTLIEQTRCDCEVIVWDNASQDGSADAIEAEFGDRVRLVRSGENLGFAGANNAAAELATGRYLLLLNPDTEVLDGAVDKLLAFAEANPDAGIWGGRTVFEDGRLNPTSCWARPTLWSYTCQAFGLASAFRRSTLLNPEGIGGWKRDSVREVDIVSGCFLLITRELWDRLGGFDRSFFMYGEDADLCLRAKAAGARPLFCPDATIVHHGGRSEAVRSDKIVKLYRAKLDLVRRHWRPALRPLAFLLLRLNVIRRLMVWRLLKMTGKRGGGDAAEVFRVVWQRRADWLTGSNG